jgi:hypothetical protein
VADPDLGGKRRRAGTGGAGISAADGGGWIDEACNLAARLRIHGSAVLRLHLKCSVFDKALVKRDYPVYYYRKRSDTVAGRDVGPCKEG